MHRPARQRLLLVLFSGWRLSPRWRRRIRQHLMRASNHRGRRRQDGRRSACPPLPRQPSGDRSQEHESPRTEPVSPDPMDRYPSRPVHVATRTTCHPGHPCDRIASVAASSPCPLRALSLAGSILSIPPLYGRWIAVSTTVPSGAGAVVARPALVAGGCARPGAGAHGGAGGHLPDGPPQTVRLAARERDARRPRGGGERAACGHDRKEAAAEAVSPPHRLSGRAQVGVGAQPVGAAAGARGGARGARYVAAKPDARVDYGGAVARLPRRAPSARRSAADTVATGLATRRALRATG
eukprot:ctg_777.g364